MADLGERLECYRHLSAAESRSEDFGRAEKAGTTLRKTAGAGGKPEVDVDLQAPHAGAGSTQSFGVEDKAGFGPASLQSGPERRPSGTLQKGAGTIPADA